MMRLRIQQCTCYALAAACLGLVVQGHAQALRDPTAAPPALSAVPGGPAPFPVGLESGVSVIVRDGKAGLVVGTRVVLPGQKVGPWTLERITETEIWLRNRTILRKVSRFNGIQRQDPAQVPACVLPACVAPPTRSSNP